MRVAYFDCFSGISGDMTLAALLDLGIPETDIRAALASLGLSMTLEVERVKRCGQRATLVNIRVSDSKNYRFLPEIEAIISASSLTERQQKLAIQIFRTLGKAEAKCHGLPLERVHFHEVGALDSIADIVGVAVALDLLGVDEFHCGPVAVGSGTVPCAHGVMPVPAPATAELLRGFPLATSPGSGELATPTGAAILATVVHRKCSSPSLVVEKIGVGAGSRDPLNYPNILRLFVGTASPSPAPPVSAPQANGDMIMSLECNLDDMPAEVLGYCFDLLLAAGALDVFYTPIFMKKNRPGVLLRVLAAHEIVPLLEAIIFRETGTFGIRRTAWERSRLQREAILVNTEWGPIWAKRGWNDHGHTIITPEYDDCVRIAREKQVPLRVVMDAVRSAAREVPAE